MIIAYHAEWCSELVLLILYYQFQCGYLQREGSVGRCSLDACVSFIIVPPTSWRSVDEAPKILIVAVVGCDDSGIVCINVRHERKQLFQLCIASGLILLNGALSFHLLDCTSGVEVEFGFHAVHMFAVEFRLEASDGVDEVCTTQAFTIRTKEIAYKKREM